LKPTASAVLLFRRFVFEVLSALSPSGLSIFLRAKASYLIQLAYVTSLYLSFDKRF
jgi:hypothetical protein